MKDELKGKTQKHIELLDEFNAAKRELDRANLRLKCERNKAPSGTVSAAAAPTTNVSFRGELGSLCHRGLVSVSLLIPQRWWAELQLPCSQSLNYSLVAIFRKTFTKVTIIPFWVSTNLGYPPDYIVDCRFGNNSSILLTKANEPFRFIHCCFR